MKVTITRDDLLTKLQMVQPGLAAREILQQSSSYIFKDGYIMTFNEEIACRIPSKIDKEFCGAVPAAPLLSMMQKMKEETVDLEMGETELLVIGKRKRSGFRVEKEIMLEIGVVSKPGEWYELPGDYGEAVELVAACAGKDESKHSLVCIHMTPKYLESMDNNKAIRYKIKTPIEEPTLIRHDTMKNIVSLGMTKISDTNDWLHFKNPAGLVLSCRKYVEIYPDLDEANLFKVTGTPTVLPSGLTDDIEMAQIFSHENADDDKILIKLMPGKMTLRGEGVHGWFKAGPKKIKYQGAPIEFLVAPKLLIEISKHHTSCEIAPTRLKVTGDNNKFIYISLLSKTKPDVETTEEEVEEESNEE